MKTQHTPGPWYVFVEKHNWGFTPHVTTSPEPKGGAPICTFNGLAYRDGSETEANARLIAAAPDLFDALSDLLERIERSPTLLPHISADTRNAARAAITKATQT